MEEFAHFAAGDDLLKAANASDESGSSSNNESSIASKPESQSIIVDKLVRLRG